MSSDADSSAKVASLKGELFVSLGEDLVRSGSLDLSQGNSAFTKMPLPRDPPDPNRRFFLICWGQNVLLFTLLKALVDSFDGNSIFGLQAFHIYVCVQVECNR